MKPIALSGNRVHRAFSQIGPFTTKESGSTTRINILGIDVAGFREVEMIRERALKVVMTLAGLLYAAAIYPIVMALRQPSPSDDTGDTMMMSLYFTLGIFLLLATRNPSAHRSLIAFTAWSNFAHAVVMTILGFYIPLQKAGFIAASAILAVIGIILLALAPAKRNVESMSASVA